MASKVLSKNRYYGKICLKHPEFNGLRKSSHHCVQCATESTVSAAKKRYDCDPEYRNMKSELAIARNRLRGSRIPPWADRNKIEEIYKEARKLGLTVDHVIPLRGKGVCGLHVHNNLQMLPASANSSKGNKFTP